AEGTADAEAHAFADALAVADRNRLLPALQAHAHRQAAGLGGRTGGIDRHLRAGRAHRAHAVDALVDLMELLAGPILHAVDRILHLAPVGRVGTVGTGCDVGDLALMAFRTHRYGVVAIGHRTGTQGHRVVAGRAGVGAQRGAVRTRSGGTRAVGG